MKKAPFKLKKLYFVEKRKRLLWKICILVLIFNLLVIDYSINGLCTGGSLKMSISKRNHHRTNQSPWNKLVMRIELTREILSPQPADFQRNSTFYFLIFFIYGNMFPESRGYVVEPVTSSNNLVSLNLTN